MEMNAARTSAVGEAIERYSASNLLPDEVKYCSWSELNTNKLHPSRLVLYRPEQYYKISYSPFEEKTPIGWVSGYSLVNDKSVDIPAHPVFLQYPSTRNENICQVTSSGLATGSTIFNAILSASLEVIERDAFIICWHNQLSCLRVDPLSHPDKHVFMMYRAYERRGVELQLYKVPTDVPFHVFMAIAFQVQGEGPCVTVGLGADFSAAKAATKAVIEIGQIRPYHKRHIRQPKIKERINFLIRDPRSVIHLEDHSLLYADKTYLSAFEFLFHQPLTAFKWENDEQASTKEQAEKLVRFLASIDTDLIYYNLTPPDMEKFGLYTCRVIIPDFQPLHFGWNNIRLGGTRMFELPVKLGLRTARTDVSELHIYPHPLT